ncbi:MAG: hypothetical protein ACRDRL_29020 [Sciscionella sp.]
MARALNSGPALSVSREADYADIERYYRDLLDNTAPPADLAYEPVKIGPTWQWDNGWLLPAATLGWGFLSWTTYWLTGKGGKPWLWTPEQVRFLLWYYALDVSGDGADFSYHTAWFQRLKGHGKDPLAAGVSAGSLHAPVVFDHWEGDRPIGHDEPDAWTQLVAVNLRQTQNTMKLFPSLIPAETRAYYGIQIGKENVWSDGDRRQIQAVTQSAGAIEGGRPKQIIGNEPQNWDSSNAGHDMAGAIEGNAAKAEVGAPARTLWILNAYRPGRDSVAERARVGYEEAQGEDAIRSAYGVLWDSLEAPPEAPLTAEAAPDVVRSIAGDSTWLDTRPQGRIVKSILNPSNSPSESRRKWFNQITGTEDSWVEPRWVDQCIRREMALEPGDRVVLFGDGSKSNDDTGMIAVRLADGFAQTLFYFHPTDGEIVDRLAMDSAVENAFEDYKVVAFWFDPSHAKADDAVEDDRFWWPLVDQWHQRYSKRLDKRFWAVRTGDRAHAIAFDMLKPSPQQMFQPAVSQVAEDLEAGVALHHGGERLRQHMKNARRREARYGITIGKEHRSSQRKVDLAVCFVGARMLMRLVNLKQQPGTGKGRVIILPD